MELLVVGATGRTGQELVAHAVARGHTVRALARSAGDVSWPAGVTAIGASVLDPVAVDEAIAGVDGIAVAISMVRTSDFPWARILTPTDLHVRAAQLLTQAAIRHGVKPYATISAQGVGDSRPRTGRVHMALVDTSNIGVAYRDLERAEAVIRATDLDWVIARPTRLAGGPATRRWAVGHDLVTGSRDAIRRADVAAFMVDALHTGAWRQSTVTLTQSRT